MPKCKFCGKDIDKNNCYQSSPRTYYCNEECFEKQNNKIKYKPKKVEDNGEPSDRRKLTDYIQSLYYNEGYKDYEINWSMICSQISKLLKNNKDWTYSGIKYTLWYMITIKDMNLFDGENGSIINLVPFEYENAKIYYSITKNIKNKIEEYDFDKDVSVVKHYNSNSKQNEIKDWNDL